MNELALFAGAGGGILGGALLGWKTVCAVEIDAYCTSVLIQRQNDGILPPFPIWDDVCTFDGKPWSGIVDVVSGGFPCQPFSAAGLRAGALDSRDLWGEMARIIREVRPKYVLAENVPGLLSNKTTMCIYCWSDRRGGCAVPSASQEQVKCRNSYNIGAKGNRSTEDDLRIVWRDSDAGQRGKRELAGNMEMENRRVQGAAVSGSDCTSSNYQSGAGCNPYQTNTDPVGGGSTCERVREMDPGNARASTTTEIQDIGAKSQGGADLEAQGSGCEICGREVDHKTAITVWKAGTVLGDLAAMGYSARWGVLGAADVGAPHLRERIWIRAKRRDIFSYPEHNLSGWREQQPKSFEVQAQRSRDAADDVRKGLQIPREIKTGEDGGKSRRSIAASDWWSIEPDVVRVVHGLPGRVDRIRCLGNGQVPQCAAEAWRILSE